LAEIAHVFFVLGSKIMGNALDIDALGKLGHDIVEGALHRIAADDRQAHEIIPSDVQLHRCVGHPLGFFGCVI
jgi:hypothetical protein